MMLRLIDCESELIWVFHIHKVAWLEKRILKKIWSLRQCKLGDGLSTNLDIVLQRNQFALTDSLSWVSEILNKDLGSVIFQMVTNIVFEILLEKLARIPDNNLKELFRLWCKWNKCCFVLYLETNQRRNQIRLPRILNKLLTQETHWNEFSASCEYHTCLSQT